MIRPEIASLCAVIAAAYPHWKAEAATFEIFSVALADIPIERLRAALVCHIQASKFPPTVAELREADDALQAAMWERTAPLYRKIQMARERIGCIQLGRTVLVHEPGGVTRFETVEELEAGIAAAEAKLIELGAGPSLLLRNGATQ